MRPLRIMLDGFGSYRERAEIDLSDVDFFVLTGPTGAGKSTVIDALCFALYGTVPRWGKENVIKDALAPSATECRVCLVFEAFGGRYAAARQLTRDVRGQVHTKEARLDRLDDSVPLDSDLAKILEASVEQLAEGANHVSAEITALLGIRYEHFTQCVLLPQGRFAEFLHAKPRERQDLLIQLLAYAVYEQVGQRARERGKLAVGLQSTAEERLRTLGDVSEEAIRSAEQRVADLTDLARRVDVVIVEMAGLRTKWTETNQRAVHVRQQLADLAALRMPTEVGQLSERLAAADEHLERSIADRNRLDTAETEAEQACAGLTELAVLRQWHDGHRRDAALRPQLETLRGDREVADAAERMAADDQSTAEGAVAEAESARAAAEHAQSAAVLAADLKSGEPCPVCHQLVGELPHHDVPADLDQAKHVVKTAQSALAALRKRHTTASNAAATARAEEAAVERQLADLAAALHDAPPAAEVDAALARREAADAAVKRARSAARTGRSAVEKAQRDRTVLQAEEQQAWSTLRASRDRFVALRVPAVDGTDVVAAWQTLLSWAESQCVALATQITELDTVEVEFRDRRTAAIAGLIALLDEHGVQTNDSERAPVTLAAHRERAAHELATLRSRQDQAAVLTAEIEQRREEGQVAEKLGDLLRSSGFERWLCAEALDSLVLEASATLMQLSGGQYELSRDARNELVVVDHNDADTVRPVNTLSGGETFQASLALALALSHQIVRLSGGRRDLDSMFLDEGFGTLDETTLETVAVTLERLAQETDRMVGIVTHVPGLAERVPVQFAVSRDGASSRLRRLQV